MLFSLSVPFCFRVTKVKSLLGSNPFAMSASEGSQAKEIDQEPQIRVPRRHIRFCWLTFRHCHQISGCFVDAIRSLLGEQRAVIKTLNKHVEGYHELTAKTRTFFATAFANWDAKFYVKVDDDVHVNLGMLALTLQRHQTKPRVYIGCMKSRPVLSQKNVKYHEPEYRKFGEEGNRYFWHATGQIYAISNDLAAYISTNQYPQSLPADQVRVSTKFEYEGGGSPTGRLNYHNALESCYVIGKWLWLG